MSETARRPYLSVVIPVFNEKATIAEILYRVQAVEIEKEIVIVDDFSRDGTRDFLAELVRSSERNPPVMEVLPEGRSFRTDNIRVIFQDRNRGKGAALRRGFQEARGEIVLIQDADLEYDPQDYHIVLKPFRRGADVVYGTRFTSGYRRVLFFWHSVGNQFITLLSNMFTNLNLTDVETCYKAFRKPVLDSIHLEEDRFGFELEITSKVAQGNWVIFEVPISYFGRTYAEGKKITWKDGFRALWCILRYNVGNRRN